jgi:hypothetical protein
LVAFQLEIDEHKKNHRPKAVACIVPFTRFDRDCGRGGSGQIQG